MTTEVTGSDVEILQLEAQPFLSIRATGLVAELGESMGERIAALSSYLRQRDAQPAGPPFVRYYTFGDTETDFEFGVPVAERVAGEGRIAAGELPGGPALSTFHDGPHRGLGDAYARIAAALKEHSLEPDGPLWEVYHWIDLSEGGDASDAHNTSSGRTQLVQPVR